MCSPWRKVLDPEAAWMVLWLLGGRGDTWELDISKIWSFLEKFMSQHHTMLEKNVNRGSRVGRWPMTLIAKRTKRPVVQNEPSLELSWCCRHIKSKECVIQASLEAWIYVKAIPLHMCPQGQTYLRCFPDSHRINIRVNDVHQKCLYKICF